VIEYQGLLEKNFLGKERARIFGYGLLFIQIRACAPFQ
jgi:hypothetical protein